jgi:hypothetical protein
MTTKNLDGTGRIDEPTGVLTADKAVKREGGFDRIRAPRGDRRLPRRPRHFAPYRIARLILLVLALIGAVAIALLVLGLLHVHLVTNHIRIH